MFGVSFVNITILKLILLDFCFLVLKFLEIIVFQQFLTHFCLPVFDSFNAEAVFASYMFVFENINSTVVLPVISTGRRIKNSDYQLFPNSVAPNGSSVQDAGANLPYYGANVANNPWKPIQVSLNFFNLIMFRIYVLFAIKKNLFIVLEIERMNCS